MELEKEEEAAPPSRCGDKTKSAAGNEEFPAGLRRLEPGLKCQADLPHLPHLPYHHPSASLGGLFVWRR